MMWTRRETSTRTHRLFISATIVSVVTLAAVPMAGQGPTVREGTSIRTPFGHPDLQGAWSYETLTPLQRPPEFAERATLTEEEVAKLQREAAERRSTERTLADSLEAGNVGTYNNAFVESGRTVNGTRRTSLVIDPPDGRVPPLTPAGEKMKTDLLAANEALAGPEDLSLPERCLLSVYQGPPMLPRAYNNNVEVFQTPDYVVIHLEMVHEPRIIPLDGRPHPQFRQWRGTSRGRWEGETLVVETKNFIGRGATLFVLPYGNRDENLEVVERFTRVDANTIRYVATVTDPTVWTKPWTVMYEMRKQEGLQGRLFEYSCHEGNAGAGGVPSIVMSLLGAAREREKAPARKP